MTAEKGLRKLWERLGETAFVLPAIAFLLAFIVYPIFYNFVLSVNKVGLSFFAKREYDFVGLQNYIDLFAAEDGLLLSSLGNTLKFTLLSIPFQVILSFALALYLCQNGRVNRLTRSTILIAYIIPQTISAMVFNLMFLMDGGIVNHLLMSLGLTQAPIGFLIDKNLALLVLVVTNVWISMPFSMLLFTAGLGTVDPALGEAAMIDGAGWWRRLFHVTIPAIRDTIMVVLTLGFINTFKVFDLVYVMTGGGPGNATQMLSTYSYKLSFSQHRYDMGAVASNVLLLVLLVVGLFYIRTVSPGGEER